MLGLVRSLLVLSLALRGAAPAQQLPANQVPADQVPANQVSATPATGTAVDKDVRGTLEKNNSLQMDGKRPFHLKMIVQLYDLKGVASEQGSLEYWWAGPDGYHLDVTAPSVGTVHTVQPDSSMSEAARRDLFLLRNCSTRCALRGDRAGLPTSH